MFALLILIVFGLLMAFFAVQNSLGVPVTIANFQFSSVPLYIVAIASLLTGVLISFLISLVNGVSSSLTIRGKDVALRKANETVDALRMKTHDLELENERLKGEAKTMPVVYSTKEQEETKEEVASQPSVWERIKRNLSQPRVTPEARI